MTDATTIERPLKEMSGDELQRLLAGSTSTLTPRDREFASSLLNGYRSRHCFTPKQLPYVVKLIEAARGKPEPARETHEVGDLTRLIAMFDSATAAKKEDRETLAPSLRLHVGELHLKLSLAGPRARVPNSLNLTDARADEGETKTWYGRVLRDGTFEQSPRLAPTETSSVPAIVAALRELAANPREVGARYGHATGQCCMCGRGLTNAESIAAGIGPICAEKFGI